MLLAAAGVVGWNLLDAWAATARPLAAGAAAVTAGVAVGLLTVRPRPHVRARARQLADSAEALVVLAIIPAAVGTLGFYELLLVAP